MEGDDIKRYIDACSIKDLLLGIIDHICVGYIKQGMSPSGEGGYNLQPPPHRRSSRDQMKSIPVSDTIVTKRTAVPKPLIVMV